MEGYDNDYVSLQNVKLTLNTGQIADCKDLQISRKGTFKDRIIGNGKTDRVYAREDASIKIKGFNGTEVGFADFSPNMGFSALAVEFDDQDAQAQSLLQSDFFTEFPVSKWAVENVDTGLNPDDPSEWTVDLLPRVLNVRTPAAPPAGGGGAGGGV